MLSRTSIALLLLSAAGPIYADNTAVNLMPAPSVTFTENRGQWDERVLFKAESYGGLTWWIERDGFTLLYSIPDLDAEPLEDPREAGLPEELRRPEPKRYPRKSHALKFRFQSAMPRAAGRWQPETTVPAAAAEVEAYDRLPHKNNYFLGNDPAKWAPDCGNFRQVALKDVWPGIDVVWRGAGEQIYSQRIKRIERIEEEAHSASSIGNPSALSASFAVNLVEFDFLIHPGADPSQIRVECLGLTSGLQTTADGGELLLPTSLGVLRQALPEAYQTEQDGSLAPVAAQFSLTGDRGFGVKLKQGYDPAKPLVVDPLVYSTYLGGGGGDGFYSMCRDLDDRMIFAGVSTSNDFPTSEGSYDREFNGEHDVVLTCINVDFDFVYCTYIGGRGMDIAKQISSSNNQGVIVVGYTYSEDFPTTEDSFDPSYNGDGDAFVLLVNSVGSDLSFSTYLGGTRQADYAYTVDQLHSGDIAVAGFTVSSDFPVTDDAFDRGYNGERDGFVSVFPQTGNDLLYSTFLGGRAIDEVWDLSFDDSGNLVLLGVTVSIDFPTSDNALRRRHNGSYDVFITRFLPECDAIDFSTFLGGRETDIPTSLVVAGDIITIAGFTSSEDYPVTEESFDSSHNGLLDVFFTVVDILNSNVQYSTFIGGSNRDYCYGMEAVWPTGFIIAGTTESNNFPTSDNSYDDSINGGFDCFIAWFNVDENELAYSSYLGGRDLDIASAINVNINNYLVLSGYTTSDNFPTTDNAFDAALSGVTDAIIVCIDIGIPFLYFDAPNALVCTEREMLDSVIIGRSRFDANLSLTFSSPDLPEAAAFEDHGDGTGTFSWQTTYGDAGNYTATFTLSDGEHEISADVPIEVRELFHVPLRRGWNLVSSAVPPEGGEHPAVWAEVVERGNLFIVKDRAGFFFYPAQNYNRLGVWDVRYGYMAKLTEPDTLVIPGDPVPEDSVIALREVWSYAAYFPRRQVDAPAAFANIAAHLEMAKDVQGRFYIPRFNYSNMGLLRRGEGYQVKISRPVDLVWNVPEGMRVAENGIWSEAGDGDLRTGENMSVLVQAPGMEGRVLEAVSGGMVVGRGTVRQGMCGLAVWGDDPTTDAVDGALPGAAVTLRVAGGGGLRAETIEGEGIYRTDGWWAIRAEPAAPPLEFALMGVYPNPFNAETTVKFTLDRAAKVTLGLYDVAGREALRLPSGRMPSGSHRIALSAASLPAGLYLLKLQADEKTVSQKVVVLK